MNSFNITVWNRLVGIILFLLTLGVSFAGFVLYVEGKYINSYSDTISTSAPDVPANHTLEFTLNTDVSPGGYIDFIPPTGFTISPTSTLIATSTFSARNVELLVNGSARAASSTGAVATDTVAITYGSPGLVRYTLNPSTGISSGSQIAFKLGTHTSKALNGEVNFSTSTGTTTNPQDIGIYNASATGTHGYTLRIYDGGLAASAKFLLALIDPVEVGPVDTREQIPPLRFNGAPEGNVGGTTLSVEMSLETDEFAICRYSTTASTSYNAMTDTFGSTGFLVHSELLSGLSNDATYTYYIRCIDDEGNFNIDDYVITFNVLDVPEGDPNDEGDVEGDGTGTGNDGTGSGDGGGGTTGGEDGEASTSGGSSGGGGSGGGGGGGTGENTDSGAGGGFESTDAPYESGDARVIINGYAFPRSDIIVLVDGQQAETGRADGDGKFSVTIDAIARGVYTFGVYAIDTDDVKSTTFSTSFSVQGARTSNLSNVNIMPSIVVNPDPADLGQVVTVSGYSIPDATIMIENENDATSASLKEFTTTSNGSGAWSLEVDTTGFSQGTYKVRAKAEQSAGLQLRTNFSDYTFYGVGQEAEGQINADLNRDGFVNLIDFSILLFWWGGDGGDSDPPADINQDGGVNLTDFSILLFQWTG